MARNRNRIILKPVLFIACEGTSTEFDYFNSWAKTDKALEYFEAINVYPSKSDLNPHTNPYQLFEKAKQALLEGSANYAWAVFDKDNHPRLPETFTEAELAGVKIAFSSRSFEEWVLLHFQKNDTAFDATECKNERGKPINCGSPEIPDCDPINCLTGHIRRQNFIPNYSKKKTFDLFSAIFDRTEIAIVNSAWLRSKTGTTLNLPQPDLHTLNPYTDVDQLIFKLHERSEKIEWGNVGIKILLDNWGVIVTKVKGDIIVQLSHTKPQAVILNSVAIPFSLLTTDDNLNEIICNIISVQYIDDSNGSDNQLFYPDDILEYTIQSSHLPYFLFKAERNSARIYVEI